MRKINELESFEKPQHVINLLSYQKSFETFIATIKNIIGASLYVHRDGETSIAFRGKVIDGTKKKRFDNPEELDLLLRMAGLNQSK
jgi:hypothetical protein